MRENKFRVWDKNADNPQGKGLKGVMICWDYLKRHPQFFMLTLQKEHDLVPLEYTGLKDKNGKEIYEGDIISNGDSDATQWVVTWNDGLPYFHLCDKNGLCENFQMDKHGTDWFKVIGNIHENSELLDS